MDGKYDGQLASQVNRIAAQAQNTGTDKKNKLLELSEFLARKASAFEAVDNENLGSVLGVTNQMSWLESSYPVAASSATINPLYLDKANSTWALCGFYLGDFKDWIAKINPFSWLFPPPESSPPTRINLPITTNVNFRDAPNGKIIDLKNPTLKNGTIVKLVDNKEIVTGTGKDQHTWIEVETSDGRTGWIAKDVLPLPVVLPGLSGDKTPTPPSSVTPPPNNEVKKSNNGEPHSVPLDDIQRIKGESCVAYAKRRRPDLGPAGGGAYNYKFRPEVFQISDEDSDLTQRIGVGYAIIWDKGHPSLTVTDGFDYGHVAIVESVENGNIVVSHANWPGHPELTLTLEQLRSNFMYVLP